MAASFFQQYLPLTVYYTINSSSTIFTFVLNYLLYGIAITSHQKTAVAISMVGILLVINGRTIYQLIDNSYSFESSFDYSSQNLLTLTFAALLVVVWSCFWSYGIIISGKHHASFHQFIFINTLVGFFMFAVMELSIPIEG
jgi:drug/metabolite transporter (DMT)-like permease